MPVCATTAGREDGVPFTRRSVPCRGGAGRQLARGSARTSRFAPAQRSRWRHRSRTLDVNDPLGHRRALGRTVRLGAVRCCHAQRPVCRSAKHAHSARGERRAPAQRHPYGPVEQERSGHRRRRSRVVARAQDRIAAVQPADLQGRGLQIGENRRRPVRATTGRGSEFKDASYRRLFELGAERAASRPATPACCGGRQVPHHGPSPSPMSVGADVAEAPIHATPLSPQSCRAEPPYRWCPGITVTTRGLCPPRDDQYDCGVRLQPGKEA